MTVWNDELKSPEKLASELDSLSENYDELSNRLVKLEELCNRLSAETYQLNLILVLIRVRLENLEPAIEIDGE